MAGKQGKGAYRWSGVVEDTSHAADAEGLRVEVWDEGGIALEPIAEAMTDAKGAFEVEFDERLLDDRLGDRRPGLYVMVFDGDELLAETRDKPARFKKGFGKVKIPVERPPGPKPPGQDGCAGRERIRHIYLKIEPIPDYNPVKPVVKVPVGVKYGRDCMRNMGHMDGTIPDPEITARAVPALVYREYLDPDYMVPKTTKIVEADVNEPAYHHRVPGTVIYTHPCEILKIHVLNGDVAPHSLHVHGLEFGIDSDGAWPLGVENAAGERSDEICTGQRWTYTFRVTDEHIGLWPFHDHSRKAGPSIDRGLFGGIIVLPLHRPKPPANEVRAALDLLDKYEGLGRPVARLTKQERLDHPKQIEWIDELLQQKLGFPVDPRKRVIHVPLFFHVMVNPGQAPLFDTGTIHEKVGGQPAPTAVLDLTGLPEGVYEYFCQVHAGMTGTIEIKAGEAGSVPVAITGQAFVPADVKVDVDGEVVFTNNDGSHHTATSRLGAAESTHCFNGRGFVGNSPTIVGYTGQIIRWHVFNLDVGHNWHNFHAHSVRWTFAGETVDVRAIGPAESFQLETEVPPVLVLPEHMAAIQPPGRRPRGAKRYTLRGDFLFHCHVHHHFMQGMAGVVRARHTVWLTDAMVEELEQTVGFPLDDGSNDCPPVDPMRCEKMKEGRLEKLPQPAVIQMHAALMPGKNKAVIWGKTRNDQSRVFEADSDTFVLPGNQPVNTSPAETADNSDLWSAAHGFLADGRLLAHGGLTSGASFGPTKCYLFDPGSETWDITDETEDTRFYASTLTLDDGRLLTMYGSGGGYTPTQTLEIYDPGTAGGTWVQKKSFPPAWPYLFYPWTYLMPDGTLFVAGPQREARRFDWTATPIADGPGQPWLSKANRGQNMEGTSVMLTLEPPSYAPKVLIIGGNSAAVAQSVQSIEPMAANPSWSDEASLTVGRNQCTATLLPDGRVLVAGGVIGSGGLIELFDPDNPEAWRPGPELGYERVYHSSLIVLPDGSVLIGGDDDGPDPCERYYPGYAEQPRPSINAAPANVAYGASFNITTGANQGNSVAEVAILKAGAVTHGWDQSTRRVLLEITGSTPATVTVTAPPNGNVAPPGYYLLYVLNPSRVPSVGRWIRIG